MKQKKEEDHEQEVQQEVHLAFVQKFGIKFDIRVTCKSIQIHMKT